MTLTKTEYHNLLATVVLDGMAKARHEPYIARQEKLIEESLAIYKEVTVGLGVKKEKLLPTDEGRELIKETKGVYSTYLEQFSDK